MSQKPPLLPTKQFCEIYHPKKKQWDPWDLCEPQNHKQRDPCEPKNMSHYAFASGIMNLGVMLPGMASGQIAHTLGYRGFFIMVLLCVIPALLITWFVPFTYPDKK